MMLFSTFLVLLFLIDGCKGFEEYCQYDTFSASCPDNEIILLKDAKYGRMRIGKCVTVDLGSLGCYVNTLSLLDKACSGKQACNYDVAEKDLALTKPCSTDFSSYLEIEYTCVQDAQPRQAYPCLEHQSIPINSLFGYISSRKVPTKGWGTLMCPWVIQALPGQSINITVINFDTVHENRLCRAIGFATDTDINQNVTICNPSERVEHVMMSVGHSVTLQIIPATAEQGNFLIEYQVIGCADLVAPDHAWHKRVGNNAIVGCEYHNKTWHLKCDGYSWLGVVGNCSSNSFPFLLIIIGIVATTVLIGICIISLVLRPKCACSKSCKPDSHPHFDANSIGTSYGYASNKAHTRSSWACTFKSGANTSNHIWETPLPEPSAPPATEHMLAATMRHPNPMETSITSSGGDYTWPTRFVSPSSHPQDLVASDYTHPSVATSQQQISSNDDYTVPVNVTQSLLHDNKDAIENNAVQDDYMVPSEVKLISKSDSVVQIQYPNLPTGTFKRQLNNILHNNQTTLTSENKNLSDLGKQEQGADTIVEYAIPNNKRHSQIPLQEQQTEEEEYTLPASMRPPSQVDRNIPSAEQI